MGLFISKQIGILFPGAKQEDALDFYFPLFT